MSQVVDVASLLDPGFAAARLPARQDGPDLLLAPPGAACPEAAREQWQGLREVLAKEVSVHLATAPSGGDGAWAPEALVVGRDAGGTRRYLPGAAGHVEGAESIPWESGDFDAAVEPLDRDAAYVLYCASGRRAGEALARMTELGFTDVHNAGGLEDVADVVGPVVTDG